MYVRNATIKKTEEKSNVSQHYVWSPVCPTYYYLQRLLMNTTL